MSFQAMMCEIRFRLKLLHISIPRLQCGIIGQIGEDALRRFKIE